MDEEDLNAPETAGLLPLTEEPSSRHPNAPKQRTPNPLPWPQLSVVLFARTCDALAGQSIHPYINQVRNKNV
jgi:hypothetical protein